MWNGLTIAAANFINMTGLVVHLACRFLGFSWWGPWCWQKYITITGISLFPQIIVHVGYASFTCIGNSEYNKVLYI